MVEYTFASASATTSRTIATQSDRNMSTARKNRDVKKKNMGVDGKLLLESSEGISGGLPEKIKPVILLF